MLMIGLALTVVGAVLAFDLWNLATKLHQSNTEFTPWGRRLGTSHWPNPARFVGWGFFAVGVLLLGEDLIAGLAHLAQ